MIETARRCERQVVGLFQSRPAVGAADELLRQSEAQLGMRLEIGESRDAFALRVVAAHRQCVRVVETERHAGCKTHRRELAIELGQ